MSNRMTLEDMGKFILQISRERGSLSSQLDYDDHDAEVSLPLRFAKGTFGCLKFTASGNSLWQSLEALREELRAKGVTGYE